MEDLRIPRLLTVKECHQRFGMSTSYFYGLARRGEITAYKVGKSVRIPDTSLIAWLETQQVVVGAAAPTTRIDGETLSAGAASGLVEQQ
jgi:excisionase family DNA binding protein